MTESGLSGEQRPLRFGRKDLFRIVSGAPERMVDQYLPEGSMPEAHESRYSVWRQDDNGNVLLVKAGLTEADAARLMRDLESTGHKQTYWVKKDR